MKILLVDDDAAVLDVMMLLLEASNGNVVKAVNEPKLALQVFREAAKLELPFDVVITDFNMPGWSGLTLAMHIANCCAAYQIKAPVICITGNPVDARRLNDSARNPISIVLEKPAGIDDIETAMKCAVERYKGEVNA